VTVFVDTSVWYAAADRGDSSNAAAKKLLRQKEPYVTTDHELVETWALLRHRISVTAAERFWDALRSVAQIEPVLAADLETAWSIGQAFRDQELSIVDRTSFAVMQRLGIDRAASFDDDFAIYRFGPGRRRSFTVLR